MVKNIVNGLVVLHNAGFVHRDIRWQNILWVDDVNKYILIDFEHAGCADEKSPFDNQYLNEWDMYTLEDGLYTRASDMYQLGKMLCMYDYIVESESGKEFLENLRNMDHKDRMTANQALEHQWIT